MHDELRQLVTQAQQRLRQILRDADALAAHLVTIQSMLPASPSSCKRTPTVSPSDPCTRIAIVNGHRLTDDEVQALDEDSYDVILDTINSTLRYRETPETHSELRLSDSRGIGPYRIRIIAFMIERFGVPVCSDNIDALLGEDNRVVTAQAFTKSVSMLRHALGGKGGRNLYIQSVPAWEASRRINALAYRLNPKRKYLLIKQGKIQKSRPGHDAVTEESGA